MSEQNVEQTTASEQGIRQDVLWFAPALLSALVLFYVYLRAHQYPAFGSGLYLLAAERIAESGYALPARIPHYTAGGVPFSYPPLMFYVVAVVRDVTGVGPITLTRFLPGMVTVAYLVPVYLLARDLLDSRPQAALTSLVVAVNPAVLQWHISAGGIVRAPAFLFSLSGIYAGVRLYRDPAVRGASFDRYDERWVVASLVLFALTILTHPVYTVFFALSYGLFFLVFDRSVRGAILGALVGVGGVLLTAPWWAHVITTHGIDVFTAAAGTHGGLGGTIPSLSAIFHVHPDSAFVGVIWLLVPVLGLAALLWKRRYVLPAWFVAVVATLGTARFSLTVGAFVTAVFVSECVGTWVERTAVGIGRREVVAVALAVIATVGLAGGALYATSSIDSHAGSPSLPEFVDDADVAAMAWVAENTAPSATFVVQGDAAEWFPQQTRRTMLVGPWGVEWRGHDAYRRQLRHFRRISTCDTADCLTRTLAAAGVTPDYVYVPKDTFTVRGMQHRRTDALTTSLRRSARYRQVFENEGVHVFAVR